MIFPPRFIYWFSICSLVAIVGPVGCGKSSVLNVILKELPLTSGTVEVNGSVAYASQEPWLFVGKNITHYQIIKFYIESFINFNVIDLTGSIRQNILFGAPMIRTRYNLVVKKCALERDFSLFPNGDKTIVGERGVSLSGGKLKFLIYIIF